MVSLVGVVAVKFAGSGLGNTGAAEGAGAEGSAQQRLWRRGRNLLLGNGCEHGR